jgi:hypothetical protein
MRSSSVFLKALTTATKNEAGRSIAMAKNASRINDMGQVQLHADIPEVAHGEIRFIHVDLEGVPKSLRCRKLVR